MASAQQEPELDAQILKRFLGGLTAKLESFAMAEDFINQKTAHKFSPFQLNYIWLDENMSSRILADLFNPQGSHGQGRLFLDSFLNLCQLNEYFSGSTAITVKCEATTDRISNSLKRMDILMTSQGQAIAVENKIWASDQPLQAQNYLQHLKKIAPNSFCLVYLAPKGKNLSEGSLTKAARQEFKDSICESVTWQDLLQALLRAKDQVEAQKLCFFLDDFIQAMYERISYIEEDAS